MLVKLTKGINFLNILGATFLYLSVFHSFSILTVKLCNFVKRIMAQKLLVKCWRNQLKVGVDSTLKTTVDGNWRSLVRYFFSFSSENVWINRLLLLWRHAHWMHLSCNCKWNPTDTSDNVMPCYDASLGEWPSLPSNMSNYFLWNTQHTHTHTHTSCLLQTHTHIHAALDIRGFVMFAIHSIDYPRSLN
jgi:hypothetical protein